MDSISSSNNETKDSNTNNNNKEDIAQQAIYENGEFQLIEHLLQQQEKEKTTKEDEDSKEERETRTDSTNKIPTNENETEVILVREESHHTHSPRYNQPIINQTKIRTTTSTDYTMHASSSSPLASFQPGQATNILQQRNENFLKNSTNIITNLSPMVNQRPLPQVPTKPRTIITLPHLIGARNRNQNQQQQQQLHDQNSSQTNNQSSNKTPIIIRERIEPPTLAISTPTTINITSVSTNMTTSPINTNINGNSNQINRISSSSPSTNSSSTNHIYSTSSSSSSSSPASSTSSQNSVPITITSRQTQQNNQVSFNPVVSPTISNKTNNINKSPNIPVITSNETLINNNNNNNNSNFEYSPLKNSLQNKIVMNAATFTPLNNFTYEINSSKLNTIGNDAKVNNDKNNNNTREASANQNSSDFVNLSVIDNKYVRMNSSPKSSTGVIFLI